jgi:hypothetical protein
LPVDGGARAFRTYLHGALSDARRAGRDKLTVLIDISSANRLYIAAFFELVCQAVQSGIQLDIISAYAFSKYTPPPHSVVHASVFGPVTPFFSGWDLDLASPVTLILGLDYEKGRALGAIEFLEPNKVITFGPQKGVGHFDRDIVNEGESLAGIECHHVGVEYDVNNFTALFWQLDSVVSGLITDSRVVIVPFGPKLFALAATLVAIRHRPKAHLYRVSGDQQEEPVEKLADPGHELFVLTTIDQRIPIG